MVKVSLVVPVYNVENYLARCLDYCINQSYVDIEIICINDGSTDGSLNILNHYQKLDSRIKIINKENGGLSSARNAGIAAASGKYVLFVDSDDFISTIAVEKLVENAEKYNSDMVVFDYINHNGHEYIQHTIDEPSITSDKCFNIDTLGGIMYNRIPVATCFKLYNLSFIKENEILFDEGLIYEDVAYYAKVFTKAKRITYLSEPLYSYTISRDGRILERCDEKLLDIFSVYEIAEKNLRESGYYEKYKLAFESSMISDIMWKFSVINNELKPIFFERFHNLEKFINLESYKDMFLPEFMKNSLIVYQYVKKANTYDEFLDILRREGNGY